MNSVGKDSEEKRLGETTQVHVYIYCTRATSCEDKLATYRMQKAANSGIAGRVAVLLLFV